MDKENVAWAKTIINVYKYLEKITGAIDKIFETRAIGGSNMSGGLNGRNSVINLTNTLINLIDRKITLINLKVLTEDVLCAMDNYSARILIQKYCDGRSSEQIAKLFNISRRTYFRKLNTALVSFKKVMAQFGYDEKKLKSTLKNEKWILDVYKKMKESSDDEMVFDDCYITSICSRINKQSVASC